MTECAKDGGRSLQIEGKRDVETGTGRKREEKTMERRLWENLCGAGGIALSVPLPGVRQGIALWKADLSSLPGTLTAHPGTLVHEMRQEAFWGRGILRGLYPQGTCFCEGQGHV